MSIHNRKISFSFFNKQIIFLLLIIFLNGCGVGDYVLPNHYPLILDKSIHFLRLSATILTMAESFKADIGSRFYYFVFSLARVIYATKTDREGSHKDVWNKNEEEIKNLGMKLKIMRENLDYNPSFNNEIAFENINLEILDSLNTIDLTIKKVELSLEDKLRHNPKELQTSLKKIEIIKNEFRVFKELLEKESKKKV